MEGKVNSRSDLLGNSKENSIKEKVSNFLDSVKSKATKLSTKTKALIASVLSLSFISSISSVSAFTGTAVTLSSAIPIIGWITAGVAAGAVALGGVIRGIYSRRKDNNLLVLHQNLINKLKTAFSVKDIKELNKIFFPEKGSGNLWNIIEDGTNGIPIPKVLIDKIKYYLKYSTEAEGDLSSSTSPRVYALNSIEFYEKMFISSKERTNNPEIMFLTKLRELLSLQASDLDSGVLKYLSKNEFAKAFGLTGAKLEKLLRYEWSLNLYEINLIENVINKDLTKRNPLTGNGLSMEAQEAYDIYKDSYEYRSALPQKIYERNRLNYLVELYIIQNGLDGRTGEPMPLTNHLEIHHIDGNPNNNKLDNLVLVTRTNHKDINKLKGKEKIIAYKEIAENRLAMDKGEPGLHWESSRRAEFERRELYKQKQGEAYIFEKGLELRNLRVQSQYIFQVSRFDLTRNNVLIWLKTGYLRFHNDIQS